MTLQIAAVDRKDQSVSDGTNKACICESESNNNVKQELIVRNKTRLDQLLDQLNHSL